MLNQRPFFLPFLAVAVFALAGIAPLPIEYYTFLRWLLAAAAVVLTVVAIEYKKLAWIGLAIPVFVLWMPLFGFFFDKSVWIVFDFLAAAGFIAAGASLTKAPQAQSSDEQRSS